MKTQAKARVRRALWAGSVLSAGAVLAGAVLAGCAIRAGARAGVAYTYPVTVPALHATPAARGAVAFRAGDRIDLYLPYFHLDVGRRPQHFVLHPDDRGRTRWRGGYGRLPMDGDVRGNVLPERTALHDDATGRELALLPPGALAVAFPEGPKYGALAGRTLWLVPAGAARPAGVNLARAMPPPPP